jgi:hypothetical protein
MVLCGIKENPGLGWVDGTGCQVDEAVSTLIAKDKK